MDFTQAGILLIHLGNTALPDLHHDHAARTEGERLDPGCAAALAGVLRMAPGTAIEHPDVDLLEQRGALHARSTQERPRRTAAAARFLITHKNAIVTTALAWWQTSCLRRPFPDPRAAEP
ncbi:hypothetical protein [Lacimonas salitolerans]|uniref:hypothetical protein n=1 Tax=Lacimonas salitolerans TaxID=1323750 RepID=UPI0036D3FB31